jgi:hypothetical protein
VTRCRIHQTRRAGRPGADPNSGSVAHSAGGLSLHRYPRRLPPPTSATLRPPPPPRSGLSAAPAARGSPPRRISGACGSTRCPHLRRPGYGDSEAAEIEAGGGGGAPSRVRPPPPSPAWRAACGGRRLRQRLGGTPRRGEARHGPAVAGSSIIARASSSRTPTGLLL